MDNEEGDGVETECEGWSRVVDGPLKEMFRFHILSHLINSIPSIVKDLFVSKHPVAVHEEQKWGKSESIEAVLCKSIIQSRWLLHKPGNNDSLGTVLVEIVEGGDWEEEWHAESIEHSDVGNVDQT